MGVGIKICQKESNMLYSYTPHPAASQQTALHFAGFPLNPPPSLPTALPGWIINSKLYQTVSSTDRGATDHWLYRPGRRIPEVNNSN